ncbi:MAG: tRNA (adenosine(37)-N6)-threonylcarbamoyltransferase complex ATPase subunit type 1 TsaE [Akkermansiaceae bacterium]
MEGSCFPKVISSPDEMVSIGSAIGKELAAGSVIALCGDLGAGKTHFSQGLAAGLGFPGRVTSPTFSLVHEYRGGRLPVFHFDFYRMDDPEEVIRIGWDDFLDEEGVVIVEWPDKFPELLPPSTQWLKITHEGERRHISYIQDSKP